MKITNSKALFKKAKKLIPGQSQTFSKSWTQYPLGCSPIFSEKADGGYLWDVDGNKYSDFIMALGPIILGYCDDEVNKAVVEQVNSGSIFSLSHFKEVECAEKISSLIPLGRMARKD